jgi:hypothetical protein
LYLVINIIIIRTTIVTAVTTTTTIIIITIIITNTTTTVNVISQSIKQLTMGWANISKRDKGFHLTTMSRLALEPIQPPNEWAVGTHFSLGLKE